MEMIKPDDLPGVATDLARSIIVAARSIAPCIDFLEDGLGEDDPKRRSEAIAILKLVASDHRWAYSGVKSQRTSAAAVEFFPGVAGFSDEQRASLRSLCEIAPPTSGLPLGSFPKPARAVSRMWPEDR